MKDAKIIKRKTFLFILLLTTLAAGLPVLAAPCDDTKYRSSIVTYKELDEQVSGYGDQRCNYYTGPQGGLRCKIRMRGKLYYPKAAAYNTQSTFPVIVMSHGSEETFEADRKFCQHAEWFVPKGYIIFAPFRRGQGDPSTGNLSTGAYIGDVLDDWQNGPPYNYAHNTSCTNTSCYKAEILTSQADLEIAHAIEWLQRRADVNDDRIAIMGISYGGAVTVFANRLSLGQKVAVAFSPGVQQWDQNVNCVPSPAMVNCGTDFQKSIISAAWFSNHPAFYLQARWDYDTRATIDLAYAHAYGSSDTKHSRGWNAAIYPYQYPCATEDPRSCTSDDYQSIHSGFFGDVAIWGPAVRNFLRRYDVK